METLVIKSEYYISNIIMTSSSLWLCLKIKINTIKIGTYLVRNTLVGTYTHKTVYLLSEKCKQSDKNGNKIIKAARFHN